MLHVNIFFCRQSIFFSVIVVASFGRISFRLIELAAGKRDYPLRIDIEQHQYTASFKSARVKYGARSTSEWNDAIHARSANIVLEDPINSK